MSSRKHPKSRKQKAKARLIPRKVIKYYRYNQKGFFCEYDGRYGNYKPRTKKVFKYDSIDDIPDIDPEKMKSVVNLSVDIKNIFREAFGLKPLKK